MSWTTLAVVMKVRAPVCFGMGKVGVEREERVRGRRDSAIAVLVSVQRNHHEIMKEVCPTRPRRQLT